MIFPVVLRDEGRRCGAVCGAARPVGGGAERDRHPHVGYAQLNVTNAIGTVTEPSDYEVH